MIHLFGVRTLSIADEIAQLEELRAHGTLTDAEFAEAKQRVLAGGSSGHSGRLYGIEENTWCMLMHLSPLASWSGIGVILPIVMWAISKDESDLARRHGARMMNWLISSFIYAGIGIALSLVFIGVPILVVLGICCVVFPILAAIKCNNNELWSYPMAIEFLSED